MSSAIMNNERPRDEINEHEIRAGVVDRGTAVITKVDPNQRNNTLVAESDYRAVMNVFSQQIEQSIHQEGEGSLKQQLFESMMKHLSLVVTVATDEAFHTYCLELDEPQENSGDTSDETLPDFQISDFDEDELQDDSVLERARALREQVRQQAQRVAQARDTVLQKADKLTQQHMEQFLRLDKERKNRVDQDQQDVGNKKTQRRKEYEAMVQTMQGALQQTKERLRDVETKVPMAIEKWNRQMEALQEGGRWGLSQTEQTIRNRSKDAFLPVHDQLSPEERVLSFLS